jgi:DNA-binding phage protein
MTKPPTTPKLTPFDAARYLRNEGAVTEYMRAVFEMRDPELLLLAMPDVARARDIVQGVHISNLPAQ